VGERGDGDEPIGNLVSKAKYGNTAFPEAIYVKAVKLLIPIVKKYNLQTITFVPSLNNKLMDEFATNLSKRLGLRYMPLFSKKSNVSQKSMTNYIWQKKNAQENYGINTSISVIGQHFLLRPQLLLEAFPRGFRLVNCATSLDLLLQILRKSLQHAAGFDRNR
jgi:hypothetical protein